MAANGVLVIVLKVQFYCLRCKAAVMKTVSTLMGIDKIEIDAEKSTVTVTGTVDPVAVVKQVRKVKKIAEIVTVGPPKVEAKNGKDDKEKKPCEQKKPCELPICCELPVCCKTCEHISIKVEEYGGCAIM